ncbi:MAG: hypothetical protein Kow00109_09180 [Acidobacteriota bacterium]
MHCASCGDTGWLLVTKGKHEVAQPCPDCRGKEVKAQLLKRAGIPARYLERGFDVYSIHHPRQAEALQRAVDFVEAYPQVDRGLLFVGPCGVGKTHLAVAILRRLVEEKGVHGRFVDESELLRRLQFSYGPDSPDTERDVVLPLMETELLVWDDLGTGRPTDWVRETLRIILNHRYTEGRLTILTTNYRLETADTRDEKLWEGDERRADASLAERIGVRLYSRIMEMAEVVEVTGPDARTAIHKAGRDFRRRVGKRTLPKDAPAEPEAPSPQCPSCGAGDVQVLDRFANRRTPGKTDFFCKCAACGRHFTARLDATSGRFDYPLG